METILMGSRTRSHGCSQRLERLAGKLARAVLRGGDGGNAIPLLDTMRFTVMNQQNKSITDEDETFGTEVANSLESIKHYLWHGNVDVALERLDSLSFDLDRRRDRSSAAAKLYG
ncbi:MAG: hypothetical protein ACR2P5_02905, partial [Gammaproteobacteria bacterium]